MVSEIYYPIWGGAENQLRQLIPNLMEKGCNVEIVTRRWYDDWTSDDVIDGIFVKRLGIPGRNHLADISFIVSLILYITAKRKWIDILHSHGAVNMGALCSLLARLFGLVNVAKIASAGRIPKFRRSFLKKIVLKWFKNSSAIISMTDEIDEELAKVNTLKTKIFRITNGVDGNRFKPITAKEKSRWKVFHGFESSTKIVLFSGRLVFGKGLDILLDAWPIILSNIPNIHLIIVGNGNDQIDSIENKMKQKVSQETLANITFWDATPNPEELLKISDLFIFPSRQEGFPNALMEALSTGLPVVASEIGGVIPLIQNEMDGLLFEKENWMDLANKAVSLLLNEEKCSQFGIAARSKMLRLYSFDKISSNYYSLYQSLLLK